MLRNNLYRTWVAKNDPVSPEWGIEILDGAFSSVVLQIVTFGMDDRNGGIELEYHCISKPDGVDLSDNEFIPLLEVILNDILSEAIELVKNERENRNNDTK